MSDTYIYVTADTAQKFAEELLESAGCRKEDASIIAQALVLADLRGIDTHGINRLPGYLDRVKAGVLNVTPDLHLIQKTPVMGLIDAQNTFGFLAGCKAVDEAINMATTYGVGIVAVKNSGHYGMGGTYCLRAMEKGFGAMAFTNSSRSMPAWGSKEPLLGTSPFAVGLPGGQNGDFLLDMSPSVVARGKIRKAARRGESIPEGWALDEEGRTTTDPVAALKGVVLPIGGPKGSGIAMMMDIFGGLMSGASFAGGVNDQYHVLDKPQGVGHFFMVFRPDVFLESTTEYTQRMDLLMHKVRTSDPAGGVNRVYTPGEIEKLTEERRRVDGIPFTREEVNRLETLAEEWGCGVKLGPQEVVGSIQSRN
ncbi:uncharacterized protein A1O5_06464 [Cladophialophora psammophila CBS 110553]|uniref:Alcohol dehydrogenase n=1 Tax=Cladophialophora psammophila CBS 110553 TaxID=1182543 RepID=W9X0H1_9EURO|nr:uncharacterized protein A1O5_06464 [Cladophialophora psammophila CBS 110553]EXJ70396.1 hypothetical protein A1O5_06464 [Cladophialophora psammophila CBS 110553]